MSIIYNISDTTLNILGFSVDAMAHVLIHGLEYQIMWLFDTILVTWLKGKQKKKEERKFDIMYK